jgi:hypothetical protein
MILLKKLLLLGMLAGSLCHAPQESRYIEVLQATSQAWVAGVAGGGRGVNYSLQIRIKTNKPIKFDTIWVAGKKLVTKAEKGGQYEQIKSARNKVVTVLASEFTGGPGRYGRMGEAPVKRTPVDSVKAPVAYKGAALLQYVVNGAAQYIAVPEITVLPAIYLQ